MEEKKSVEVFLNKYFFNPTIKGARPVFGGQASCGAYVDPASENFLIEHGLYEMRVREIERREEALKRK